VNRAAGLGLFSLAALVVGNMVGAGVFTTSGFALQDLHSPLQVLLAWLAGGLLALCGAVSYGVLARLMPQSGGEYLFLSRTVHPLAGFIAGWISLLAGFTGAIALAAIAFEAYLLPDPLRQLLPQNAVATAVILLASLAHGRRRSHGVLLQNLAVVCKLLFLSGFIAFALLADSPADWTGVRAWRTAEAGAFSPGAFALAVMWISFSYSGFNAAIYVAGEAADAVHAVPRAMLLATVLVTLVYLVLNGIFVFAPAPSTIAGQEDVAALAALALAGEGMAAFMRAIIALALLTSVSAMIMAGPRVYARMAEDGLMPVALRFRDEVPAAAVALQALLAIVVVWVAGLRELLSYLGFTLSLSAAATVASLFVAVRRLGPDAARPAGYPWAPAIFVMATLLFAALAALRSPREMAAALVTFLLSGGLYYLVRPRTGFTEN